MVHEEDFQRVEIKRENKRKMSLISLQKNMLYQRKDSSHTDTRKKMMERSDVIRKQAFLKNKKKISKM